MRRDRKLNMTDLKQVSNYVLDNPLSPEDRSKLWVSLDIVIPVYNEEEVLNVLFKKLETVFSSSNQEKHLIKSVNYLMIDDGSKDRSAEIICQYIGQGNPAVLYRLSRNYGHQNAVSAGLEYSTADVVGIIDADLQDPPEAILDMIKKWREGFDLVYGVRKKRKEGWYRVGCYWVFYRILAFLSEVDIALDSGDFCLMEGRVVEAICRLPEKIRFPRVLRSWVGFSHTAVEYERQKRQAGRSKYSFSKLYKLATDGIVSASIRPLRISQYTCILFMIITGVFMVYAVTKWLSYVPENEIALWFVFGYLVTSSGFFILSLCIYALCAYVGRMFIEVKGRPSYIIMEVISKDGLIPKGNKDSDGDDGIELKGKKKAIIAT